MTPPSRPGDRAGWRLFIGTLDDPDIAPPGRRIRTRSGIRWFVADDYLETVES